MLDSRQLVWRCRRGVRELDVLFTRFLESEYPNLELEEQQSFQALLEVQDPTIMDWLFGKAEVDQALQSIIYRLQNHAGINKD